MAKPAQALPDASVHPQILKLRLLRERHQAWCREVRGQRDPLLGSGRLAGTIAYLPVRDFDVTRPVGPCRQPIPYALHTREADGGGQHSVRRMQYAYGGARWTPGFARYIGHALTLEGTLADQAENTYTAEEWWRVTDSHGARYLEPKVRAQFGDLVCDALLMVLADGRDRDEVAEELCKTRRWLSAAERRVANWVKREYGLGGRTGPLDGGHAYSAECPCTPCQRERARDVARFAAHEGAETYAGGGLYDNVSVA